MRFRRDKLHDISRVVDSLRAEREAAPDFSQSILSRVHEERPFLAGQTRRCLYLGRAAIGLSVAVGVLGLALANRFAPGRLDLASSPAPLSNVLADVQDDAGRTVNQLRTTLNDVSETRPATILAVAFSEPVQTDPEQYCSGTFVGPMVPPSVAAMCEHACRRAMCVGPNAGCCRLKPAVAPRSFLAPPELRDLLCERAEPDDFGTLTSGPTMLDVAGLK